MQKLPIFTLFILMVTVFVMGCNDDPSNEKPSADLSLEPNNAMIYDNETGLDEPDITFNATGSNDPDGEIRNYHYDYGEGNTENLSDDSTIRTFEQPGYFRPSLTVSDSDGETDTVHRILIINYQYSRENQVLDSTAGNLMREHPFPVSEYDPFSGIVTVLITIPELQAPNVNVTVLNGTDEEVAREERDSMTEDETITIELTRGNFDDFDPGLWKVVVEVENGSITYDIAVQIIHNR